MKNQQVHMYLDETLTPE